MAAESAEPPTSRRAVLTGSGSAELTAYGTADAEATLEKICSSISPVAELRVLEIRRLDRESRIVERFRLEYRLRLPVEFGGEKLEGLERNAFAAGRRAVAGSVLERVVWQRVELAGRSR